jgi:hypothetical protein
MAAIDLNAIGELLREEFEEPWIEAVDRDNFLLQRFGRTNMDGGAEVRWKVHYAGNPNAGPYSENDVIPTPGAQAYTQARSPIKQNWVAIEASGLAQAATQGSAGFVDLIAEETEQSLEDLKDRINDQLLATTADGTGRSTSSATLVCTRVSTELPTASGVASCLPTLAHLAPSLSRSCRQ